MFKKVLIVTVVTMALVTNASASMGLSLLRTVMDISIGALGYKIYLDHEADANGDTSDQALIAHPEAGYKEWCKRVQPTVDPDTCFKEREKVVEDFKNDRTKLLNGFAAKWEPATAQPANAAPVATPTAQPPAAQ